MTLRGTKTEENILKAFAGESQARNKYTYFAEQAHQEGNAEVAALFERMAKNERAHAKIWYTLLNAVDNTEDNLKTAAIGESYEAHTMYPEFAAQARVEGLETLALLFEKMGAIEQTHELAFSETLSRLKNGEIQTKSSAPAAAPVVTPPAQKKGHFRCSVCGFESGKWLKTCPLCRAAGTFEPVEG